MTGVRNVLLLIVLILCSGCGVVKQQDEETKCDWMHTVEPQPGVSGLVVLIDRSNSTRARSAAERVVDPVPAVESILSAAIGRHDVVSVGSFDGTAASVEWMAERWVTDRGDEHERRRSAAAATARECLGAAVTAAANAPPSQPGTDILGALGIAKDGLAGVTGDRRIVVITDGLATVGCADLTRLPVGKEAMIAEIRGQCARQPHAVPDLNGVHLALVGVGHPAAGAAQPGTVHLRWLSDLWTGLCGDAMATSCEVSVQPVGMVEANARTVQPDVADPSVTYPPVAAGLTIPTQLVIQLSGEVLFTRNSSTISDQGKRAIAVAAERVRGKGKVTVNGYTQADATPALNAELAKDRALAVAGELRALGINDVVPVGHAGRAPQCPKGDTPAALRCTRRVDIVVEGSG